jgi:ribosome-binding protein aMBF1 (putative translation factor)
MTARPTPPHPTPETTMTSLLMKTAAKDDTFRIRRIKAEENFHVDIAFAISDALQRKGWSRAELARHLGWSETKLSANIFEDEAPMEARHVAAVATALGMKPTFKLEDDA